MKRWQANVRLSMFACDRRSWLGPSGAQRNTSWPAARHGSAATPLANSSSMLFVCGQARDEGAGVLDILYAAAPANDPIRFCSIHRIGRFRLIGHNRGSFRNGTWLFEPNCTEGLAIEHSPTRCQGKTNRVCDFICDEGYHIATGPHICLANGTFVGGGCALCPVGHHAAEGAARCSPCRAGTNDDDSDPRTACVFCGAGRYTAAGATNCSSCDAGKVDDVKNT